MFLTFWHFKSYLLIWCVLSKKKKRVFSFYVATVLESIQVEMCKILMQLDDSSLRRVSFYTAEFIQRNVSCSWSFKKNQKILIIDSSEIFMNC